MKIGIDISQVVYKGTGVASYTYELVKALLHDSKNEYVLFGSSFGRQKELLEVIEKLPKIASATHKIYSVPIGMLSFLWNKLHFSSIEQFVGPLDVFHTSDWVEPPSKMPKVTTIHDLMIYKMPQHLPDEIIDTQKRKLRWVQKEASAIIADSESTKRDIMEILNISEKKIHVVYLGVDDAFFPQKIDEVRRIRNKYDISGSYLLSVGTREPRKNLLRTINAFKKLGRKDVTLVIAGNFGWGEDVGVAPNIKILGYVSFKDLPALYSGAAGFVYPSLYEGFGLPILEAMSCGTLVVTSNRGSLAEIDSEYAFEVNPEVEDAIAEGMRQVLDLSTVDRKKMIQKSMKHAQTFTWEKTAKETLAVYKSVIR